MSLTVVSASESVAHSEVASVGFRSEVIGSIPRPSAVVSPAVTAAIDGDKVRTTEVEVVSVGVAGVYSEPPVACVPIERAVEKDVTVEFDYLNMDSVMRLIKDEYVTVKERHFDNRCRMTLSVQLTYADTLMSALSKIEGVTAEYN